MKTLMAALFIFIFSSSAFATSAAIALNNISCKSGHAYDYDSLTDAEDAAIDFCGAGCRVVARITDKRGYVALATGKNCTWGISDSHNTVNAAISDAISHCKALGGVSCDWRTWVGNL